MIHPLGTADETHDVCTSGRPGSVPCVNCASKELLFHRGRWMIHQGPTNASNNHCCEVHVDLQDCEVVLQVGKILGQICKMQRDPTSANCWGCTLNMKTLLHMLEERGLCFSSLCPSMCGKDARLGLTPGRSSSSRPPGGDHGLTSSDFEWAKPEGPDKSIDKASNIHVRLNPQDSLRNLATFEAVATRSTKVDQIHFKRISFREPLWIHSECPKMLGILDISHGEQWTCTRRKSSLASQTESIRKLFHEAD